MSTTRDFSTIIRAQIKADPALAEAIEQESFNAHIACQIYEARSALGLTQTELAQRVKTTQSVIARLEDADYDGHSLSMLKRIAKALGCRLSVDFYQNHECQKHTQSSEIASALAECGAPTSMNLIMTMEEEELAVWNFTAEGIVFSDVDVSGAVFAG